MSFLLVFLARVKNVSFMHGYSKPKGANLNEKYCSASRLIIFACSLFESLFAKTSEEDETDIKHDDFSSISEVFFCSVLVL